MTGHIEQQNAAVTESARLATSAYADERRVAARQSIYQWQQPSYDLPGIVAEQLAGVAGTVLDVSCGSRSTASAVYCSAESREHAPCSYDSRC